MAFISWSKHQYNSQETQSTFKVILLIQAPLVWTKRGTVKKKTKNESNSLESEIFISRKEDKNLRENTNVRFRHKVLIHLQFLKQNYLCEKYPFF